MPAFLKVRAVVADGADRQPFDEWYQNEHLPDAYRAFNATRAWRAWSEVEPSVHYAFYRFESLERAQAIMNSPPIKELIAAFDKRW
ncbi:MAG: hypothetical protein GKR94_24080 [Gammaproteobacteria bacterium]|nr:hypothetical protein [Gammaproteobacteria bacterium]